MAFWKVGIYEFSNVWIFEFVNVWIFEFLNFWNFDFLNIWILKFFNFCIFEFFEFFNFGILAFLKVVIGPYCLYPDFRLLSWVFMQDGGIFFPYRLSTTIHTYFFRITYHSLYLLGHYLLWKPSSTRPRHRWNRPPTENTQFF